MSSTKVEDKSWILVKDLVMALIVYAASSTVNSMSSRGPWTCSRPWTRSISNFKCQDMAHMDPDEYDKRDFNMSDWRASVKALTQHLAPWTRSSARSRPWLRPFSRPRRVFRCPGHDTRSIWKTQLPQDPVATKKVDCFYHHLVEHLCSQRSFVSHKCSKRSSPRRPAHQDYQESLAPSQIHTTQFLWAEWLQHFSVDSWISEFLGGYSKGLSKTWVTTVTAFIDTN